MNELREFLKKAAQIIRTDIKNGTPDLSRQKIKMLRRKMGLDEKAEKLAEQIAKNEIKKLGEKYIAEKYSAVVKESVTLISEAESAISSRVLKLAAQSLKNVEQDNLLRNLSRFEKTQQRYLQTVANTAQSAVRRSQLFIDAQTSDIKKFRYEGSEGGNIRDFCKSHVGKIYTLSEIKKLDNGQGLSVQFYCGGYNCRHRWVAVVEE